MSVFWFKKIIWFRRVVQKIILKANQKCLIFSVVTIRELEESDFVGKIDASVILFPEPLMTGHERVRRAGNGKVSTNDGTNTAKKQSLSKHKSGRQTFSNNEVKQPSMLITASFC